MLGTKDEIRIEQAVVHILDSALGMPVLSDVVLDCCLLYTSRCV